MIQPLPIRPIMLASELRDAGVHPRDITAALERGDILRAARGVYVTPEVYVEQQLDDAIVCHKTGGVIGHLSAAQRHGLCDASPAATEILIGHTGVGGSDLPIRLIRSRNPDTLSVGVDHEDFHGLLIRMTDRARTVVDLYRIEPKATRQHAIAALTTYLGEGDPVSTLYQYAKTFDCWQDLQPEVEAVQATLERGMSL
ncbi:type IV toxin-antitoxin system AbiEi family antitoxin domain-containing protein [Pelagibacterium luteolum]|uniref:Transcriptional regulator, AbiEi antitoxin, Type IV TA system n=1 Tax=Pelagibacterium luteolum TaxID=440168 RepID=A0A1G7XJJ0_9HYPH|nr:type IV toxin-antitoxin system AbiEi family antitoxin domain-containing protein [Pelagibacterium luteolum]SDG83740.1 Transcriptional regulator, AbiEi antitoxin, Type IV TA system [Pelagibacterium luteolum]